MERLGVGTAGVLTTIALAMACAAPARAAGWEEHDFETPFGDRGVVLRVAAVGTPDVHLGIGCDADTGDRWRGVAVIEEPESRVGLGMAGAVVIHFGDTVTRDTWAVKTTAAGRRVFTAPESTRFARRLLREEAAAPNPKVTIEINGVAGRPVALAFPLTGLAAKIDKLAARCDDWDLKSKEQGR